MFTEEDKTIIKKLGLENAPEAEQAFYLQSFFKTLQLRVGMILEGTLNDEQLAAFEKAGKSKDDQATAEWLKKTVPDFDSIVAKEQAALIKEIQASTAGMKSAGDKQSHT